MPNPASLCKEIAVSNPNSARWEVKKYQIQPAGDSTLVFHF